jgi:signal transduction histidine kinase
LREPVESSDDIRGPGKMNGEPANAALVADAHHLPAGPGAIRGLNAQDSALLPEARETAKDLAALDRLIIEYLPVVSHELRNSLGAIRFAARLMEMNTHEPFFARKARLVIVRQAEQMARLIDDLLEVSRSKSPCLGLRRERVDLRVIARHAVESVELDIAQRKQRLLVALPDAPVWLQGDPGRLAQVLVNLLNNAAKYTDDGGELRLSVEWEADQATVSVRDSGIGIAPDLLPHVFESFMQAEFSLPRSEMGIGIGLAVVRGLVELHGGRVSAASAGLGLGSEFTVHLPAARI